MIALDRTNKYAAKCFVCAAPVKPSRGFLLKREDLDDPSLPDRAWLTLCNSKPCVASVVGEKQVEQADLRAILADGTIAVQYDEGALPFLRAMGSWDSTARTWRASPHRRDRDHVLAVAAKLGLTVAPEFAAYEDPEPVRAAVARARAVPTIRDYQIEGVRWLAYRGIDDSEGCGEVAKFSKKDRTRGALLGDDPGLGKTLQTLLALHDDEALVVICNKSAKAVWPREAKKWRPDRFDTYTLCEGVDNFRWPTNTRELVVINYDILSQTPAQLEDEIEHATAKLNGHRKDADAKAKWKRASIRSLLKEQAKLQKQIDKMRKQGAHTTTGGRHYIFLASVPLADCVEKIERIETQLVKARARKPIGKPSCPVIVVGDELHYVENVKALRTQRWRHVTSQARRIVGLTGTPVESNPLKLWGLLTSGSANPFSWNGFIQAFNGSQGLWGGYEFARHPPAPGSTALGSVIVEPGTTEQLGRCMLRRSQEEVLSELPPMVFTEIPVEIGPKLRKDLDEIVAIHASELLEGEIPPFAALSATLKALAKGCIPTMLDLVDSHEQQDTPVVVFSANRSPIEALQKRPGWFTVFGDNSNDAGEVEDRFQAGEGRGVAGTQAMAEAMTLTRASTLIQVIPFMSRKKNKQAYKRLHRIGQDDTVNILLLVPDHVLVHHILALLVAKDQFVGDVLEGDSTLQLSLVSRFEDEDEGTWRARAEAKLTDDAERAERGAARARAKRERELSTIAARDVSPKVSEQRAKLRAERLTSERGEAAQVLCHGVDAETVRAALDFMLARCDGAREKDDEGFNAPDSAVARWLAPGVGKGSQYATASAAAILKHYPRQLKGEFPELFE